MEFFTETKFCKYCLEKHEICTDEGVECEICKQFVHVRCLKRGSVPGGLNGDVFYIYKCQECNNGTENFIRNKISWLQVIILVLYHLQTKSPGLARRGFFHWRNHVATFIDRYWEILFSSDVKKRKKWTGTVAGTLSHFSSYIFLSGTSVFNEPAFWTLAYPRLSPQVISQIYSLLTSEKQKAKLDSARKLLSDAQLFQDIIKNCIKNDELIEPFNLPRNEMNDIKEESSAPNMEEKRKGKNKKKRILPSIDSNSKKLMKMSNEIGSIFEDLPSSFNSDDNMEIDQVTINQPTVSNQSKEPKLKLLDPFCHYNTSLNSISRIKGIQLQAKLTGGLRKELILSPYSGIYLKPYIRRDVETFPTWLKMMAELQLVANKNNPNYELPPRGPIDYTYVQPEHIPAINSLCNHFFWPGINLTESLQYPEFSCVVLYKRLIVGFAFLVPDVKHTENYISFIFTRPGWRNCGIGKFMLYHLIQTSLGKDITLHVSINNPALFLYQKFGFKVEQIVQDFYDKYFRNDVQESKHAFFCRLER